MYYLTFLLKEPDTQKIRCVGVKYKKTPFTDSAILDIAKKGTSNIEIKSWLKALRSEDKVPIVEIIYKGEKSIEACWHKQQIIINHQEDHIDLLGTKISNKKYTKKLRKNEHMRRPIIDQHGVKYPGVLEAGELLLLAPSNISKVLYDKLEHIGGYSFKFL
jgi:hypothetical protein